MINVAAPIVEEEEIKAVSEVLRSKQLAQGPKVAELEASFAKLCGTEYAVAVNSGTAALHAALFALGVGPGDEVITVPFSFIATVNCILMVGAKPAFVDIDPDTFNLDPVKLEAAITPHTKAIIPVHLFGQPCNMQEIQNIADRHGLKIVEDACQAVGATYGDKMIGAIGDAGCFSLYATKNVQCGEGGILTTNSEAVATIVKQFRQHGMTAHYDYQHVGYNYRLSDLHASIAVEQLKKLDAFTERRRRNAKALTEGLAGIPGLILPKTSTGRTHVYHQFTVRITDQFPISRQSLADGLKKRGIGSAVFYPNGLHLASHVKKLGFKGGDFPVTEVATSQVVSLPVHPSVSKQDTRVIIAAVKELAHV